MTRYSDTELDAAQGKPRPKGVLPWLPDNAGAEELRAWLTRALRPPEGYTVHGFERTGRDPQDAAYLVVANGRDSLTYRFRHQSDLIRTPRTTVVGVTDARLNVPHLTGGEVEDLWTALCRLGTVLSEHDESDEAREWVEQMLKATMPLQGHSLVPDTRHDALMALRHSGEFSKGDALAMMRPGEDQRYLQRPTRFIDAQTGEQWLRAGETATFVRWCCGVEPLSHGTLRARLREIGMVGRLFEAWQSPHPKAQLYALTESLILTAGGQQ